MTAKPKRGVARAKLLRNWRKWAEEKGLIYDITTGGGFTKVGYFRKKRLGYFLYITYDFFGKSLPSVSEDVYPIVRANVIKMMKKG